MSLKNCDNKNRWRSKTIGFRVSPEEDEQINRYVKLSGLTKQDYITRRLTCKEVVIQGNPRVFKALRDQLAELDAEPDIDTMLQKRYEKFRRVGVFRTINQESNEGV